MRGRNKKIKVSIEVKKQIRLQLKSSDSPDDRLLAKVMLEEELTEFENNKWKLFSRIIALTEKGYPNKTIAKIIQVEYGYQHVCSVYSLINRALSLMGDVRASVDPKIKKIKRQMVADEFKELAQMAKKENEYKDAAYLLDKAAHYEGLDENQDLLVMPNLPTILLSTDPNVLNIEQNIDVDFTEQNHENAES